MTNNAALAGALWVLAESGVLENPLVLCKPGQQITLFGLEIFPGFLY